MHKLALLAILAAAPAFAQITAWPPVVGTGAINVNPSAPDNTLNVAANGDVQVGTRSSLTLADLNPLNGYIGTNLVSSSGNFKYSTTAPAEWLQFAGGDIYLRTAISGNAGNSVVPLTAFQIKNGAPDGSLLLDASGNFFSKIKDNVLGAGFTIQNSSGSLAFVNNTGTASNFAPTVSGVSAGSGQSGLALRAQVPIADDTGSVADILLFTQHGAGGPTTRPVLEIKNYTNSVLQLDASGNLTVPAVKSTTGTRYVCADTTGKLVSSATACSGT
jgi:hypothetical protein